LKLCLARISKQNKKNPALKHTSRELFFLFELKNKKNVEWYDSSLHEIECLMCVEIGFITNWTKSSLVYACSLVFMSAQSKYFAYSLSIKLCLCYYSCYFCHIFFPFL